jgi:hypothetical protein
MDDVSKTKFKIKMGAAEIEFEGNAEFLKNEIMPTVGKILEMVASRAESQNENLPPDTEGLKLPRSTLLSNGESATILPDTKESSQNISNSIVSLPSYLKAKNAGANQNQRFLAVAAWLQKKGTENVTASVVVETLLKHKQAKLGNAPDCLNQNVRKGYCEKTESGFFVTPEGWVHLGDQQ